MLNLRFKKTQKKQCPHQLLTGVWNVEVGEDLSGRRSGQNWLFEKTASGEEKYCRRHLRPFLKFKQRRRRRRRRRRHRLSAPLC